LNKFFERVQLDRPPGSRTLPKPPEALPSQFTGDRRLL
jgi:hypothetical protein